MFIGGQPVITEQKASEADCNRTLVRLVKLARTLSVPAIFVQRQMLDYKVGNRSETKTPH
jgi:hypothetical protein